MRAWRAHDHGDPSEVLHLEDVPAPAPGEGQVRLAVTACALNFADDLLCRGTYQERPGLPLTPGMEVVGRVEAAGPGASLPTGTRVLGAPALPHGGLAESCLAHEADLLALPDDIDDVTAACLYITYQTGWIGLHHRARLQPGEVLLVHAGAGGVGSAAIQLGVAAGARVVATAGGADKMARCRDLGAELVLDHRSDDVVAAVKQATGGRGADVVYDSVGGASFEVSRRAVAFEGRILLIGFASGTVPQIPANHVLVKNYDVLGLQWPAYRRHRPELVRAAHASLLELWRAGSVAPLVSEVVPLAEATRALAALAGGRTTGKLVVRPGA